MVALPFKFNGAGARAEYPPMHCLGEGHDRFPRELESLPAVGFRQPDIREHTEKNWYERTGTPERIRTSDLYLRRVALYPLSYWRTFLVPKVRFELTRPQGTLRPERSASACSATSAPASIIALRVLAFKLGAAAAGGGARPAIDSEGVGRLAQMVRARRSHRRGHWFESSIAHQT